MESGLRRSTITGNCRISEIRSIFESSWPRPRKQKYRASPNRTVQFLRRTNITGLTALRNNCSLTAGKEQYGTGQETKAAAAKNKRQSRSKVGTNTWFGSDCAACALGQSAHLPEGRAIGEPGI